MTILFVILYRAACAHGTKGSSDSSRQGLLFFGRIVAARQHSWTLVRYLNGQVQPPASLPSPIPINPSEGRGKGEGIKKIRDHELFPTT
jgi:hypothetical protein